VRCDRGEVEEERLLGRRHELARLACEHVGRVVGDSRPVVDEPSVLVERVVVVALLGYRVHRHPGRPAGRHVVVAVDGVVVEVLADQGGVVTRIVQPDDKVRPLVEMRIAVRPEILDHTGRVRVLAREQRGSRGAALRRRDKGVRERDPVRSEQPLHVRHPRVAVPALVVGQDHDEVQPVRSRSRAARRTQHRPPENHEDGRDEHRRRPPRDTHRRPMDHRPTQWQRRRCRHGRRRPTLGGRDLVAALEIGAGSPVSVCGVLDRFPLRGASCGEGRH
jgi:hypothetical protein